MQLPPEKLGSFYLGAEYDLATATRSDNAVNYDARDLTTHAVCVGMTGSGKTGLCIGLLEEAALDKVPAILLDPKGDITNLLLQFPELQPDDFRPWINPDDARRKGKTIDEFAVSTAEQWRTGLGDWGITGERIRQLNATTDYTIYTPGSDAGMPISILSSLAAPKLNFDDNAELIRDRITGTVSALLGLVGVDADPVRSRESILLANIFEHFWRQGQDMDLAGLIMAIQTPPVRQLGVFDVDTFFPQKDRFGLAMAFNNLVASPSFQSWLIGDSLDIDKIYYTAEGKPRHAIFYIAHLSDNERMFFVTLLLENLLTWVRGQSGTTSLRALIYFDEVFGFFPPVANPPSKKPLLTLLKQARAFGVGVILVTQNPVDIDYKGLTNAGTWFIGKLQAERDKARVLEGLKGAIAEAGGNTEVDYDTLISQLGSRVFLLHNINEPRPIVFNTRWAMSYLRGPLTRPQVRQLMADRKAAAVPTPPAPSRSVISPAPDRTGGLATEIPASVPTDPVTPSAPAAPIAPAGFSPLAPSLEPSIPCVYLPVEMGEQAAVRQLATETGRNLDVASVQLVYEPAILGAATVRYVDRRRSIDEKSDRILLVPAPDSIRGADWNSAERLPIRLGDLTSGPERVGPDQGPFFAPTPEGANSARELKDIAKDFADWIYYNSSLTIKVHPDLGIFQRPDERERDFKIRLQQAAREKRDAEVDALKVKSDREIERIQEKLKREERDLAADQATYDARKREEAIGIGETVLGFFMGRRSSTGLSKAATKRRMTTQAKVNIDESTDIIADLQKEVADLEAQFKDATDDITRKWADLLDHLESDEIKPRRTDVDVRLAALAWLPSWLITYTDGNFPRTASIAAYPLPEVPE